jgi:putative DNA primase/helicase
MFASRDVIPLQNVPGSFKESGPYASVPVALKELRAWLPFKITLRSRQDAKVKTSKVPYNSSHKPAKYTDPHQWMTFEAACEMLRCGSYNGIGIVIDRSFGIVGYDADSCISDGAVTEKAREHLAVLNTYSEISLSGAGLHCLAYGRLPPTGRRRDGFEMYCDKRFLVVTGLHLAGTPKQIERRQAEVEAVHEDIFGATCEWIDDSQPSVTQLGPITQVWGEGGGLGEARV